MGDTCSLSILWRILHKSRSKLSPWLVTSNIKKAVDVTRMLHDSRSTLSP